MKTITLVAHNRLNYLKTTIDHLKRNNLDGYQLFIGVEPCEQRVIDYCRCLDFMPINLTVNPTKLGVAWNPLATINRAFASGSEFNVALEDDLIVSPDALDLANWYFRIESDEYFCLNLLNYDSDVSKPSAISSTSDFVPLGWCVNRKVWTGMIEPHWMCDSRGWDFSVNRIVHHTAKCVLLHPRLSRTNHNGRLGGTHCTSDFHDETFKSLPISQGDFTDYFIEHGL